MFRKILAIVALVIGLSAVSVSAKDALYSDIDTYINHYPINAYAVDGKMAIVAEDLRDYGFNVVWDGEARALYISRNEWVTQLTRKDIYDPQYPSGTKLSKIYASDIKVYYNGTQLTSYALNGYTLIPINDFASLAGSETWVADARAYKVWIDGLSICEYQPLKQRCYNLWYDTGDYSYMPTLNFWEDMNSDGHYENVVLSVTDNYYDISVSLKIGESRKNYIEGTDATGINAVYVVDMIPNDNAKEIAVFYSCYSGEDVIKIYRYRNGSIKTIPFNVYNDLYDELYIGWNDLFPFFINDDGSFTISIISSSYGMWRVYETYKVNDYGYINPVSQDTYSIDEASWSGQFGGYFYVNKTCTNRGFALYKGDRIKLLADDMQGHILLQKSNGKQGWFTVGTSFDGHMGLEEVSDLFMMAG